MFQLTNRKFCPRIRGSVHYLQQLLKIKKPLKIIPGTTSSNMESLISLYSGWAADYIVLLDSDKEGLKQKDRYINLYGPICDDRIFTYADINSIWQKTETENLFTEDDRLLIQTQCYPTETKYSKTIFNRSIQELYIAGNTTNLTTETLTNFENVVRFLKGKLNIP